jgi:flagellar biosynthetic protein FliQ
MDGDLGSTMMQLAGDALIKALMLSAPAVLAGLLVGFIVSLFQAVTQIQEQTLTFVPKIIAVFLVVMVTGGWMVEQVQDFTQNTMDEVIRVVRD